MPYTLTIQLTDDLYNTLLAHAERAGQPVEQFIVSQLTVQVSPGHDPLHRLIGTLESSVHDWVENHDHYIGLSAPDNPEE